MEKTEATGGSTTCRYDLPDDALRLIFSRMSVADQIRSSLVCNRWKTLLQEIISWDGLPWMLLYRWHIQGTVVKSVCKLYAPSEKKTYTLEDGIKGQEERGKFVEVGALASKKGWVLFQRKNKVRAVPIFLFCPYTGEVIDLPDLSKPACRASFSCSPKSAGCVLFAFGFLVINGRGVVSICRRGGDNQAWKTFEVDIIPYSYIRSVVYCKGSFYCLFDQGRLGAFSVATEQWDLLCYGNSEDFGWSPWSLTEFDGQLFTTRMIRPYKTFRFDFSGRIWVEEASHPGRAYWNLEGPK
ncbi:hypothetical protein Tsubulata_012892 [Turnera subulata]|uniref:F-box domain-containing protein n=1 Tax=Turnera subulata TaxID=218843 RepID=A0A9Q0F3S6_9ROSI|nr:hypothetical protein Tsubulata_012892 [Turnera subulata]